MTMQSIFSLIFYILLTSLITTTVNAQPPAPVIVAPVKFDIFVDTLEALGTVKANESVDITSQITEIAKEIYFYDGDQVEKGQLLVLLDDEEEQAQLKEAEVNLEQQQREYQRLSKLVQQKAIPMFEVDAQRSRLKTAEAQIAIVKTRIALRKIFAPFSGQLGFRNISQGALVRPGEIITTLDDLTVVKLDFSVPETFLAHLETNQTVIARSSAYPDEKFIGKVSTLDTRVDPVTRAIGIRALIDNQAQKLRPGMLLTVELIKNSQQSLMVPEEALVSRKDQQYVYIVNSNQQVEQRAIQIGRRRPGQVEVLSGLTPGTQVITDGTTRVRPGGLVKIIKKTESN